MSKLSEALLLNAQVALRIRQIDLAERLGVSRRTVQRWLSQEAEPYAFHWEALARDVFPIDRELAASIAEHAETTFEALGLVQAPAPPAPEPPPQPLALQPQLPEAPPAPREPAFDARHLADSVVCAAVEASTLTPSALRPILLAAIVRARELRMDMESVEAGLRAALGK
jgi:hypothetical protein